MAVREIPTPETLRQLLRYEPESGKLFWLPRPRSDFTSDRIWRAWITRYAGKEAFTTIHRLGYRSAQIAGCSIYAHRAAWALHYGSWPSGYIDHINGSTADNRITNLRDCDMTTNMSNSRKNSHNKSGETGVSWDKENRCWRASLTHRGVSLNLGRYANFNEAVARRRSVAASLGFTARHGT